MNWHQIGEGVVTFFAAAGVMTTILIVIAYISIVWEDRQRAKQARERREDNWDRQARRIELLQQEVRGLSSLVAGIDIVQDKDTARIDQLFKAHIELSDAHDHTRQSMLNQRDSIVRIEEWQRRHVEQSIVVEDAHNLDARVTALEDKQASTEVWQNITDDELAGRSGIYERLDKLEQKAA